MSSDLGDLALTTARAAAELIREGSAGVTVADTKTSDVDVVTEVDRAAERLIRDRILGQRPDDAFMGEEGDDVPGTSGVRWIVDPIDGTVNFLYGLPHYAVSIAAEVEGEVVAGVVLNVATSVEYVGIRTPDGIDATRDGRTIGVRAQVPMGQRLLGTGFSYVAELRELQAQALVRLLPQIRDIRRFGSCALDLCAVASGQLDGYAEEGVNLWDYAAGALIAEGAGAQSEVLTGVGGDQLLVCAPRHSFAEVKSAVVSAGFTRE